MSLWRALPLLAIFGVVSGAACARGVGQTRSDERASASASASETGTGVAPAAAAEPAPEDDCTGETALVEGIPGSPGNLLPSPLHDAGSSELAALMRVMQADLARNRDLIAKGETPPPLFPAHRKIRCSWPTDPAERNAAFDAYAVAYLGSVKALDERPTDLKAAHNQVVDGCRACHETTCSGPLSAIAKLRLPE